MPLAFDPDDYELRWPPQLFVSELSRLVERRPSQPQALNAVFHSGIDPQDVEWLLTEAFQSAAPADEFRKLPVGASWGSQKPQTTVQAWLRDLLSEAASWQESSARKPYWSSRRSSRAPVRLSFQDVGRRFAQLIADLHGDGYFAYAFGQSCVDDPSDSPEPDPAGALTDQLGYRVDWPLAASTDAWPDERFDEFCDLVEALHDLVARPTSRRLHNFSNCGWHYSAFATGPGRRLYRWRVNQLLKASTLGLRLAANGEDLGRLVRVEPTGLEDLSDSALRTVRPATAEPLQHAIALFRARTASVEERRSAIIVLAGLLEEHRDLLKTELLTKDEGAIFQLLNEFAIRHRRADQRTDYDPAFLDWLYRWCLATVQLMNQLLARQASESS